MFTADQLKNMNSQEFTQATSKLPLDLRLKLAMLAGAGEKGIGVIAGQDMMTAKSYHETLDYEALAKVLNDLEKGD